MASSTKRREPAVADATTISTSKRHRVAPADAPPPTRLSAWALAFDDAGVVYITGLDATATVHKLPLLELHLVEEIRPHGLGTRVTGTAKVRPATTIELGHRHKHYDRNGIKRYFNLHEPGLPMDDDDEEGGDDGRWLRQKKEACDFGVVMTITQKEPPLRKFVEQATPLVKEWSRITDASLQLTFRQKGLLDQFGDNAGFMDACAYTDSKEPYGTLRESVHPESYDKADYAELWRTTVESYTHGSEVEPLLLGTTSAELEGDNVGIRRATLVELTLTRPPSATPAAATRARASHQTASVHMFARTSYSEEVPGLTLQVRRWTTTTGPRDARVESPSESDFRITLDRHPDLVKQAHCEPDRLLQRVMREALWRIHYSDSSGFKADNVERGPLPPAAPATPAAPAPAV